MKKKNEQSMTEGSPLLLILRFAVPIMIGNLFNQVYYIADSVIVGRFVSANALAATGLTAAPSHFFMSVCMGTCMAAGVLVAQYFGANEKKQIASAIMNSTYVSITTGTAMTIIGMALTVPILNLMGTPESLMPDAVSYMLIYMAGLLPMALFYSCFSILRAIGDARTPLYFLVLSSVLNVGLDLLFVITFGWAVTGAAVATLLAQLIAAVLCAVYSIAKVPYFRDALRQRKPQKDMIIRSFKLGIPMGLQFSLMNISGTVLQYVVNGFGESVIAAFTAINRIEIFAQQGIMGLSTAVATFSGQNIGAGKPERVRKGFRHAVLLVAAYSGIFFLACWFFGGNLVGLFVGEPAVTAIGETAIRISGLLFFALGVLQVLRNLLNGVGDAAYSLVNGIAEVISRVGFAFILTSIPAIGMWGIWWANGLAWVFTALVAFVRYKKGKWTQKAIVTKNTEEVPDEQENYRIDGQPT